MAMHRYVVSISALRRVGATIRIVAESEEQAQAIAEQSVDAVVAESITWDVEYSQPVQDITVDAVTRIDA